jgi:CubicO group peptidase (beta-lactamase class C family)
LADSAFDRRRTSSVPDGAGPGADHPLALDADHLQSTLDQWSADHPGVGPVRVSVALGGDRWSGRSGTTPGHDVDGPEHRRPDEPDDGFTTASITKLFTAALVLQEAATGHIDLDATVPETIGVSPPAVPVTPRMLLQHSSGLANYPDVVDYDPDRLYTPAEAVSLSTRAALLFDPGTDVHYSNSNFLWLGLLLEQVTGETYENLLHQRILDPLGMVRTSLDTTPTPGWAGFSSGAVASTGDDLVTFADALFARDAVLPPGWLAAMTDVDHLNVGLGAWPFCPCGTSDDGHKWFTSIGHTNAWGGLSYRPDGGAVAFVRLDAAPPDVLALHDDVLAAIWEALETPAQA